MALGPSFSPTSRCRGACTARASAAGTLRPARSSESAPPASAFPGQAAQVHCQGKRWNGMSGPCRVCGKRSASPAHWSEADHHPCWALGTWEEDRKGAKLRKGQRLGKGRQIPKVSTFPELECRFRSMRTTRSALQADRTAARADGSARHANRGQACQQFLARSAKAGLAPPQSADQKADAPGRGSLRGVPASLRARLTEP